MNYLLIFELPVTYKFSLGCRCKTIYNTINSLYILYHVIFHFFAFTRDRMNHLTPTLLLLKCLFQSMIVSCYVFVCWGCWLCLFLRFLYNIGIWNCSNSVIFFVFHFITSYLEISVGKQRKGNQNLTIQKNCHHRSRKTTCVGHHYTQTKANNVNKTWALLQTTGGKKKIQQRTYDLHIPIY